MITFMLKPPLQFRNNETPKATKITAERNMAKPIGQKQETVSPSPKQTVHIFLQSRSFIHVHLNLCFDMETKPPRLMNSLFQYTQRS